jgi:hypothetical protein
MTDLYNYGPEGVKSILAEKEISRRAFAGMVGV